MDSCTGRHEDLTVEFFRPALPPTDSYHRSNESHFQLTAGAGFTGPVQSLEGQVGGKSSAKLRLLVSLIVE